MTERRFPRLKSLGLLRQALLGGAIVNTALPILHFILGLAGERSLWDIVATMIAPTLSMLFAVVILFDYIMSRVRAGDAEGEESARFAAIGRFELLVLAVTLAFWIPYFIFVLS